MRWAAAGALVTTPSILRILLLQWEVAEGAVPGSPALERAVPRTKAPAEAVELAALVAVVVEPEELGSMLLVRPRGTVEPGCSSGFQEPRRTTLAVVEVEGVVEMAPGSGVWVEAETVALATFLAPTRRAVLGSQTQAVVVAGRITPMMRLTSAALAAPAS